jgi:hypothetical protein
MESRKSTHSSRVTNLTKQKFGRWRVLEYVGNNKYGSALWRCQCACPLNTIREVTGFTLSAGNSRSCGCLQREAASRSIRTNKLSPEIRIRNQMLNAYKHNALGGGREWGLTDKQFDNLIEGSCHYCGARKEEAQPRLRKSGRKWVGFNGIDRIDSGKGYFMGNVASCCSVCNYMKGAMELDDFLNHIRRVHLFQSRDN